MSHPQCFVPLADALDERRSRILETWQQRVAADDSLDDLSDWSRKQFYDHFPDVLEDFGRILRSLPDAATTARNDQDTHAHSHARTRWLQGYSLRAVIREWGHFNAVVIAELARFGAQAGSGGVGTPARAFEVWSGMVNDQLTTSALEYHRLLQVEAETRAEELVVLLEKFRELGTVRARALGTAAESLRNDMSVVLTSSSLVDGETHPASRAELREMVRSGTNALDRQLADLVFLARLEAGLEERRVEDFDVGEALMLLTSGLLPQAEWADTQLTWGGPETLVVQGDPRYVRLVAKHLLLSGLQSAAPGPLDLEWGNDDRDPKRWLLLVRQHALPTAAPTSPPISREIADATDRSQQSQGVPATGFEGPLQDGYIPAASQDGVNLLISKHLCELLGASLELAAREGIVEYRVSFPRSYDEA